ncbi:MAG: hypothetical protein ACKVZH_12345 [Blastocatellia bacterium]
MPTFLDRENWMSHLDKSARLVDSHIPASHDSSSYPTTNLFQMFKNEWVGAVTQLAGYASQLNAGVRYFDMRITWHNGDLYMKHSSYYYQKFSDVLCQIRNFSDNHTGEYIFMDLDFNDKEPGIVEAILGRLESDLDKTKFATAHLQGGVFNPNVTWQDLGDTRFLITWSHDNSENRSWASSSEHFRSSPYGDFDEHDPAWITAYLTEQLHHVWDKKKLMISQVINTPYASPITPPGLLDSVAKELLNGWITQQFNNAMSITTDPITGEPKYILVGPDIKPNIVMRDFVNAHYNRQILDLIITQNKFSSPPNYSTSDNPINQLDTVRYRLETAPLYLSIGADNQLRLTDTPDKSCEFLLRDYDYDPTNPLPYSGNMNGDDDRDQGNFRLIKSSDPSVGSRNDTCISVRPQTQELFYGIGWHAAQDLETFKHFDPDDHTNDGQLYSGSRVIIRSMAGSADNEFQKLVNVVEDTAIAMIPFVGPAFIEAWKAADGKRPFLMVAHDKKDLQQHVFAGSPGPDYATAFIIEKVN